MSRLVARRKAGGERLQIAAGPRVASDEPVPHFVVNLAGRYKAYIETAVSTDFAKYSVQTYTKSLPTPSSGATTGADYFISVVIDTEVDSKQFRGFAKYLILEVYVDTTGGDSLKLYRFRPGDNMKHVT